MYNKDTMQWEGYIYKIYNDINDKLYIGQTSTSISDRWAAHIRTAKYPKKNIMKITQAIREYGDEHFCISVLEVVFADSSKHLKEKLNSLERYYISHFNSLLPNGYNSSCGGGSGRYYEPIKLYSFTGEFIRDFRSITEACNLTGISQSAISDCLMGRSHRTSIGVFRYLDDNFDKYDTSRSFAPLNAKYNLKKEIVAYDIDGKELQRFSTIHEASSKLGIDRTIASQHIAMHYYNHEKKYVLFYDGEFNADDVKFEFPKYRSKVRRININTNEIVIYNSRTEACKKNNLNMNKLNNMLYGVSVDHSEYRYEFCT